MVPLKDSSTLKKAECIMESFYIRGKKEGSWIKLDSKQVLEQLVDREGNLVCEVLTEKEFKKLQREEYMKNNDIRDGATPAQMAMFDSFDTLITVQLLGNKGNQVKIENYSLDTRNGK